MHNFIFSYYIENIAAELMTKKNNLISAITI